MNRLDSDTAATAPTPSHLVRTHPVYEGFGVLRRYPLADYHWHDWRGEPIPDPEACLRSDGVWNAALVLVEDGECQRCDVYADTA